ncbi:MAG: HNH endonuclease [Dehalococcoidia bacterium]|nr:HNH endonuclease [Dehalococcoidia bacterium]
MPRQPGAKAKLREYLIAHVGQVLDSERLRRVAGTSEWARRIRELRDEEGMDLVTHNDQSSLKPGPYLLRSLKPQPSFARDISKETRALVLDRNGFTCQMCGAAAGEIHPSDPGRRTRLHIGHIVDKSRGGSDEPENLSAICSLCNEGAANITLQRPDARRLLAQIRRAPGAAQLDVLSWIVQKYPQDAARVLRGADK